MHEPLTFFRVWGSGTAALVCFFMFLVGFFVGVLIMWRWHKKPVPPGYELLDTAMGVLEEELTKTDAAVAQLWAKANLSEHQRKAANSKNADYQEPERRWTDYLKNLFKLFSRKDISENDIVEIPPLIVRLKSIKTTLESLRRNIKDAVIWLSPSKPHPARIREDQPVNNKGEAHAGVARNDQTDTLVADLFGSSSLTATSGPETGISTIHQDDISTKTEGGVHSQRITGDVSSTTIARDILDLYNRAVIDTFARTQFREQFQPIRIGTMNAVERTGNPTIDPEFRETTDGDFFACAIYGRNEYAVMPRLGLTIEAVSYNAGALGVVFNKTQGHDPKLFYSSYRVRQPATFKREGDRWELLTPGELDLGPSD